MFFFQCTNILGLGDYLTINETLYPTRGHFGFRQYNPDKPAKYGLLFRSINAVRFPFTYTCLPYSGQPEDISSHLYIKGVDKLVMALLDKLKPHINISGCNISYDNYYTSLSLAIDLLKINVSTIATLRHNRVGFRSMGLVEGWEEFSIKFYTHFDNPDIQLTSYVCKTKNPKNSGKKNVLVLSTHSKMIYGVTTDDGKKKPAIIKLYDFTKGGTDICDQRIENFTVKVKSRHWTMPALAYLLEYSPCKCTDHSRLQSWKKSTL